MLKGIKGVIFDMDGVLTETSKAHFQAWQELANRLGFRIPNEVEDRVRGISRLESLDIVLSYGPQDSQLTDLEKVELASLKNQLYLEKIKAYSPKDLSDELIPLLDYLKSKKMKIGLASASRNAPFLLEAMQIGQYFDAVVDPNDIVNGKPAPDIFLRACQLIDLPPDQCMGVEDAEAGIESIRSAGLLPVGIGALSNCEIKFKSTADFYRSLLLNS